MNSILARAVIIEREHLLVARSKGWTHFFLPGGHVESGEPPEACLKRELREELGVECEVGPYLGWVEHSWTNNGKTIFEINHCHMVSLPNHELVSKEDHLEFIWLPVSEIASTDLRPPALRTLIPSLIQGDSPLWEVSQTN